MGEKGDFWRKINNMSLLCLKKFITLNNKYFCIDFHLILEMKSEFWIKKLIFCVVGGKEDFLCCRWKKRIFYVVGGKRGFLGEKGDFWGKLGGILTNF